MGLSVRDEASLAGRPAWPRQHVAARSWRPDLAGLRIGVEVGVETETKNTVPMWLAVAITVVISLPFGLWLKEWSVPLWAAFIVWAEYFVLGGKPAGLKIMVPSYILGVIGAVLVLIVMVEMQKLLPDPQLVSATDVAIGIAFFIGFCVLIYAMKFMPVTGGAGTLPFFNGISMGLATFFVGIYFTYGGLNVDSLLVPIVTGIPAILAGLLGAFLGWFNVTILFPRVVTKTQSAHLPAHV
jgi:hypothetical protein